MIRTIADFEEIWKEEVESTVKVFEFVEDKNMNTRINENIRSLAFLSWHLTITTGEMLGKAGLNINSPAEDSKIPGSMKEITDAYKTASHSVLAELKNTWKDTDLSTEIPMYGQTWSKGKVLDVLLLHQTHHRGQMTVIMRALGMKVPGVYGPSKEEWAQYGMPAME